MELENFRLQISRKQNMGHDFHDYDVIFENWKKKNPGKSFSDFSGARIVKHVGKGLVHDSLGSNLKSSLTWQEDGKATFEFIRKTFLEVSDLQEIPTSLSVCDYGCGSLRIGYHFINHLDKGGYTGIDISDSIVELCIDDIRPLIDEKSPLLGTISDNIDMAVTKEPDLVFAHNVLCHLHPDEEEVFYGNIDRLTAKPGCLAILQIITAEKSKRYQRSGWAHPLAHYLEKLNFLNMMKVIDRKSVQSHGHSLNTHLLVLGR